MAKAHDPRTIVTPDAFSVAPGLLGVPLSSPSRRLAAIAIDGILITLLTQAGGLLLGVVAALVFFRMAMGRRASPGEETAKQEPIATRGANFVVKGFRAVLGCFGGLILAITIIVASVAWFGDEASIPSDAIQLSGSVGDRGGTVGLGSLMSGGLEVLGFRRAASEEEAREEARGAVATLQRLGMSTEDITDLLLSAAPSDGSWADPETLDAIIADALASIAPPEDPGVAIARDAVDGLSLPEALRAYAQALDEGEVTPGDTVQAAALFRRIRDEVATDTVEALQGRIAGLRDEIQEAGEDLQDSETRLAEAQEGGFLDVLFGLIDDLGLSFGWGTVYMTVFMSWWAGQTPGKRALGIRVVRLDGGPMTWWMAFERTGGYAAGVATGMLGFAQIFWDANRMAIHDKVAETVVIRDGKEPVDGPWSSQTTTADGSKL